MFQFVRFANIEEDTPSYHRRYDFFVSKFSAMCHSNHADKVTRDSLRLAGIKGLQVNNTPSNDHYIIHISYNNIVVVKEINLPIDFVCYFQGVVRKTVSDDLVENIWEAQHMEKIVPSLLYNMQVCSLC